MAKAKNKMKKLALQPRKSYAGGCLLQHEYDHKDGERCCNYKVKKMRTCLTLCKCERHCRRNGCPNSPSVGLVAPNDFSRGPTRCISRVVAGNFIANHRYICNLKD